MNPTIADAKKALGFSRNAQLARFLGVARQSFTGRSDDEPMPDGWCWRAARRRPELFTPNTARADDLGTSKGAVMRRFFLTNDTSLAVLLQLPREHVEALGDGDQLPDSPHLRALLSQPAPVAVEHGSDDPDSSRIVPVESA